MRQLKISRRMTHRESKSLEKYLNDIGKIDLLTPEEEKELAKRIKQGDQEALEKLVKANLRFVVSVAKQYQNQGLSLSDLINEGNLGLIKAAQRFDETKGFKFISYAVRWIRQSILQALAEQSRIVRLPLEKVGSLNKINKAYGELEQEYERKPTHDEIIQLLKEQIPEDELEITLRANHRHTSIDAPLVQNQDSNLLNVLQEGNTHNPDVYLTTELSLKYLIGRMKNELTKQEFDVICLYFGIGMNYPLESFRMVAEKLSITEKTAKKIYNKAKSKLGKLENLKKLTQHIDI